MRGSQLPRGEKLGQRVGSGEDGEEQRGCSPGRLSRSPLPGLGRPRVVSATLQPRRSSASCLPVCPLGLGLFKINTLRPLSTSQQRTSLSTFTLQVRRPGRGMDGGVG